MPGVTAAKPMLALHNNSTTLIAAFGVGMSSKVHLASGGPGRVTLACSTPASLLPQNKYLSMSAERRSGPAAFPACTLLAASINSSIVMGFIRSDHSLRSLLPSSYSLHHQSGLAFRSDIEIDSRRVKCWR